MTVVFTVFIVVLTICIFAAYHKDVDTENDEQPTMEKTKTVARAAKTATRKVVKRKA